MIAKTTLLIFSLVICSGIAAQEHDHSSHDHFHTHELGINLAPVYFTESKSINFVLHAHYVRRIGQTAFGTGIGLEYIFDAHHHQTYSLVFQYKPLLNFHLIAAPGIAFESESTELDPIDHDNHGGVFALHLEAVYEFNIGMFDLGPSFEFAYDSHDTDRKSTR